MNDLMATIRRTIVPIRHEGYPFMAICALAALLLFVFGGTFLGWIVVGIGAWVVYFFRDPPRATPLRPGLVVSPADGRVSQIVDALPPPELGLSDTPLPRVSVFMNIFDVHVNRAPVSGRIYRIAYKAGKFLNAELDKASEANERNGFILHADTGHYVGVVQIAGLVARRIVTFVSQDADLVAGDRIGLIRFGSRVDIYLPAGAQPLVGVGQRAIAGETVIADLAAYPEAPERVWRVG